MNIVGIISEYNPIHGGHVRHLAETRARVGGDAAIVCAMSGNFVQRGDFAVFEKHARAACAVLCGADLVVELPLPWALSSAEGFAMGGVALLEALGVCTHLSFGSETGQIQRLQEVADCLITPELDALVRRELRSGVSYAAARQRAADRLLGPRAHILKTPNNILGIEYLKALRRLGSAMEPVTIRRFGAAHDSDGAQSASALRRLLREGVMPWGYMPEPAAGALKAEITAGRGPVFAENAELALLSRLRMLDGASYAALPDATEGLGQRLMRCAHREPTLRAVLECAKTKRYALSRLRRMALCAALGIGAGDSRRPPPYIRALAFNDRGAAVLRRVREVSGLPVITKPAAAKGLPEPARSLFYKEAAGTDLYVLAYPRKEKRSGGQEWTTSPRVLRGGRAGGERETDDSL